MNSKPAPSEGARKALIDVLGNYNKVFPTPEISSAADMVIGALWVRGYKLVPIKDDGNGEEVHPEKQFTENVRR
jgi:hypothetical protein